MADAGEITWERRRYQDGDLADAWYALIATDDPEANAARLRRGRGAAASGAYAPTTPTRPPPGPRPPAAARASPSPSSPARDPRRSAAVRDAVVEGLRDGTLAAPHHRTRTPGVALVGGGPGDPDLITVRGRRLLAEADVVIADRLGPRDLLAELPPHVEVIDAAKIPYGRFMAQEAINNALIEHAKAGQGGRPAQGRRPVRLRPRHGGGPGARRGRHPVHGRPRHLQLDLASPAPPASRSPTAGVAHEFTVVSGHVAPDDERSLVDWPALAKLRGTLVLLMGVDKIGAIAETLVAHGSARTPRSPWSRRARRRPSAASTRPSRRSARRSVAEGVRPPAVIVIGEVVAVGPTAPRNHR